MMNNMSDNNKANLPPLFDIQRILPYIHAGSLLLTPNNRLRSKILQAWGDYQQAQGVSVWETPRIQVIEHWFTQQWQQLQAQGHAATTQSIINGEQQRVIWESITADCGLMQVDAVAKQAANALSTLVRWNQPIAPQALDKDINPQLIEWIKYFQQRLKQLHMITAEDSHRIIGKAFEQDQLIQETEIYLLGFDDLSPLFKEQLEKASANLITLASPTYAPKALQRVEFDNSDAEMQAAAQWARTTVEQQANVRIGIIVPNLGQCRQQVERAFTSEFEAHSFAPGTERYTLPFNFSAGTPLGDTPLIAATLQMLKLQEQRGRSQEWDTEYVVHCLLSPFWGNYTLELERRTALVSKLQSLGTFTISGDTLRYWAEKTDGKLNSTNDDESKQSLFDYLNQFHQFSTSSTNRGKHLPSRWVEIFLQQLDILQWPGERTPDSQEYQQTQLWYQLLESFAGLDSVLNAIDNNTAIQQLQSMANHMPFQAKVPDSPIQILGILEGAGLHFSHCWVMGLHQQVWPPAPSPNSLLPIRLQREHNMPHASSLRELAYAQSLTDNYRHCADTIIFSTPTHEDDGEQRLLASQLISDIPLTELTTQAADDGLQNWYENLQNSRDLELIDCADAPSFTGNELVGGAGLFKAQAENPFDSFVKYRLGAPLPIDAVNGFSHIEKGHILHNGLAAIWQQLKNQENLLTLSDTALAELITEQVNIAISDIKRHKPKHLSDPLCQIESERQSQLITQWLALEKQRPPFTVVAIEEARTITFNDMNINIRIDRVDQLADGRYLIIDYKTGKSNINAWKGERPKEPQLPLYALTYSENINEVKGISFAQINVADQNFKGLGDGDIASGISHIEKNKMGLPDTWESTIAHWQQKLDALLNEFTQGDCRIEYLDEIAKTYAGDYLRINRFHEAEAIEKYHNAHQQPQEETSKI
jgi:ATP-dependent helicase/nuclease subunit B